MSADQQLGLAGVRPFRFRCQRSGRCCTAGDGFVWVDEAEIPSLAGALGLGVEVFASSFLRRVPHPESGDLRLALRERTEDGGRGRCALLEGTNHCTVYAARPDHCRRFPYWESVLEDERGFERAREVCPGIEPIVDGAAREAAFAALEALYAELEVVIERSGSVCLARGVCCRFEEAGHDLYATALEADFAADRGPVAPPPAAPGRCPYHVGGRCTARAGRPLGCRTYFCDPQTQDALQAVHEELLGRIRAIEAEHGYSPTYAPFPALLAARGVGVADELTPGAPEGD
ncbi:YkgJ family cysteine cluster protein [Engelhardtia mirabilis]|uniref:Flagellin N-methylase n=1 Tax=Engelhardtia mirabilis TaxID=2528011 RepID=A0A518BQ37_9BACT|nr:Flagellin N-methylase [Planctomycetes bacterium Pla133]QDV03408.1 Flagellin N-methylase [Planctomycetes bacterium Pla86]